MNLISSKNISILIMLFFIAAGCMQDNAYTQTGQRPAVNEIDRQVQDFLNSNAYRWRDMNVPATDGQLLYDIIVENNYKNAVEIGTSTGHSGIWIAWALSKTGGKLITIEIDERRHKEALANFEKAGVADYVDARLADAHELVPQLKGPVDFVFSDADKDWYINYFKALDPKLVVGGCFTTHNVSRRSNFNFYNYVSSLSNYETTLDTRGGGVAISYKIAD
ncbi:MAG: class I SAM-dependent methyltransferase [Bacteroidales bacterium]|nr:class I SAM-dependent methyltransferase [Bacteroidales bacterium]